MTAKACRLNLALAALLSLGLAVAAYPLVVIAYGSAFLPSIAPLLLLLPGVTVGSLARPLGNYLVRLGRPLLLSSVCGLSAMLGLALSLTLIPNLGIAGAAVAASLSGAFLALSLVAWFHLHSRLPIREILWLRAADLRNVWPAWHG